MVVLQTWHKMAVIGGKFIYRLDYEQFVIASRFILTMNQTIVFPFTFVIYDI
jgi:hypothetical protein